MAILYDATRSLTLTLPMFGGQAYPIPAGGLPPILWTPVLCPIRGGVTVSLVSVKSGEGHNAQRPHFGLEQMIEETSPEQIKALLKNSAKQG